MPSCSRKGPKQGLVVIAIDGWESDDIRCRDFADEIKENKRSGFSVLCQEFLSLEGVIAPSTSTVANLSSFLTAQEPSDTHVLTDDDILSSRIVTWAEKIQTAGWRTAFFNSSPPISRKTNLMQGFGFSDENLSGLPKNYFRPIDQTLQVMNYWIHEVGGPSLVAVMTSSDLRFPDLETQSDTGEIRRRSIESQIEEIDESLFNFFESLKKDAGKWERLEIVVFSLQGREKRKSSYPGDLDLVPSKLVLPTFIKPTGPSRSAHESISGNWNLVDLGQYVEWRLLETNNRQLKETEILDFFERHKHDFVKSVGCIPFDKGKRICRQAFFDEITWIPWDEFFSAETTGRADLLNRLNNANVSSQVPRFNPKILKGFDGWSSPGLGIYADCIKDFRNLKSTQPYQQVCPSSFLQMLRKWFLVSKAKVESFSEIRDIRSNLTKQWQDFRSVRELWDRLKDQDRLLNLNRQVLSELLAAEEILNSSDLAEIRRELERGY